MGYADGDSVHYKGNTMPATIISGPHKTYGMQRWLIEKADGTVTLARESELSVVDNRREQVAGAIYSGINLGRDWSSASPNYRRSYLGVADGVLKALSDQLPPPDGEGFWVAMTPEEAGAVHALTMCAVTGPDTGPRGHTASLSRKMDQIRDPRFKLAYDRARHAMRRNVAGGYGVYFADNA